METLIPDNRIYLPPSDGTIDINEHLKNYVQREFPEPPTDVTNTSSGSGDSAPSVNAVYSVPREFQKAGEAQACCAEQVVFQRLHGLCTSRRIAGLWLTFFHNASYAGHSFRNQRVGKLMIREHDFVIFAKYQEKYFMVLAEVKSTNDSASNLQQNDCVTITSDAKVIKNNKRSAQHQLRDHVEVLHGILKVPAESRPVMQCNIMWPFLGPYTKDPKQITMKRWKDEADLHVFRDNLQDQGTFDDWFLCDVLSKDGISENDFNTLLSRYLVLSCGVFMDEISAGIVALLTQSQLDLLNTDLCQRVGGPLVVHGAAGTGKTLLVLRKLEQLHRAGRLNAQNRALYACYWPGIKLEVEQKLKILGIADFVDTTRFYITHNGFMERNKKSYKHIFVDEAEVLSLVFEDDIMRQSIRKVNRSYHAGNCRRAGCKERLRNTHLHDCPDNDWGELWMLVDVNQASLFMPRYSMEMLQIPNVVLSTVMRCTGYIFQVFKQFYISPIPYIPKPVLIHFRIPNIEIGHNVQGPPIYWVSTCSTHITQDDSCTCRLVRLIIDLCATKGFKPNDLCVIPFLVTDKYVPARINQQIDAHFVDNGYRPRGVNDVENFISNREVNDFLIAWALRLKGLEFKVVVIVMDMDDFDIDEIEDRRKAYIMASRCTCMLIIVSPESYLAQIDLDRVAEVYPFSKQFHMAPEYTTAGVTV